MRQLKADRGLTQAQLGELLGIAQQNAGRLTSAQPNVGMNRTTANALARALGYRDVEHFLLEAGVLAEMTEKPAGAGWRDRDVAVQISRKMGYDEAAIQAVIGRYTAPDYRSKPMRWWNDRIVFEHLERASDPPNTATPAAKRVPPPNVKAEGPKPKRRRGTGTDG